MSKNLQIVAWVSGILVFLLLLLIAFLGSFSNAQAGIVSVISSLITLIIAGITTLISWIISKNQTLTTNREHASDKIDTVAKQSHEKILNLSKQLFGIQTFIEETKRLASLEKDATSAASVLVHRLDGISHNLSQLRTSNDTFCSDWTGVVTDEAKQQMEKLQTDQQKVFDELAELQGGSGTVHSPQSIYSALSHLSKSAESLPHAVRPDVKVPAVTVSHKPDSGNDEHFQEGSLIIVLHRPVPLATGSATFSPAMVTPPSVYAKLDYRRLPLGCPPVYVSAGTGTDYDFNVHIKSKVYGHLLPVGKYFVRYTASVAEESAEATPAEVDAQLDDARPTDGTSPSEVSDLSSEVGEGPSLA